MQLQRACLEKTPTSKKLNRRALFFLRCFSPAALSCPNIGCILRHCTKTEGTVRLSREDRTRTRTRERVSKGRQEREFEKNEGKRKRERRLIRRSVGVAGTQREGIEGERKTRNPQSYPSNSPPNSPPLHQPSESSSSTSRWRIDSGRRVLLERMESDG
jgi:hypothetical protein